MNDRHLLTFHCRGTPVPGGSKRGFIIRPKFGRERVVMSDAAGERGKDWSSVLKLAASAAMKGRAPFDEPLELVVLFTMPRPRSHFRTGKRSSELRPDAPPWHPNRPDTLKLTRRLEDALTGVVWRDDSLVVCHRSEKAYGDQPGARVTVLRATDVPQLT